MRDSAYIRPPGDRVDQAWNDLLGNMSLRVTDAELLSHSQTSIPLPNGGFLAWLGVYHELHCLKLLRQMNYREYYHPNSTDQQLRDLQLHSDHCIDRFLNMLMCRGDIETLTTFMWSNGWPKPLPSIERPVHRCLDWEAMALSMKWRVVDKAELDQLKAPKTEGL